MTKRRRTHSISFADAPNFKEKHEAVLVRLECNGKVFAEKTFVTSDTTPEDLEVWATRLAGAHDCDKWNEALEVKT